MPSFSIFLKFFINFRYIKEAKCIYINSDQFGHSVSDSLIFIESFGPKTLVISLGTESNLQSTTERNRFFDKCLGNNLIGIYFPKHVIKNQIWKFINPLAKKIIKIFLIILLNRDCLIYISKSEFLRESYTRIIQKKFTMTLGEAITIVDKLDFKVFTGNKFLYPLGYLSFLMSNTRINSNLIYKEINSSLLKISQDRLLNKSFVCLAIRRSNSLYNSNSDYYFDAIDAINSAGFMVSVIGDRKYFLEISKKWNYPAADRTNNADLSDYDQKVFELLAIENCAFVIGDQGGIWSLVKAFNKAGLIINAWPVSHLQNNVESLPKKWVYKATGQELLDVNIIFNELFFKWTQESKIVKSFEEQVISSVNTEIPDCVTSEQNDIDTIIKVLKRYMGGYVHLAPKKLQSVVIKNFQENIFLQIAENVSYSEEYVSKLTGWKIV